VTAREKYLLKKYGLSLAAYDQLFRRGHGACWICLRPPKPGRHLHVDHDHRTGRLRGLLDYRCNRFLMPWMDMVWLSNACEYVREGTILYIPKKKKKRRTIRRIKSGS
jgi:hypothetical protein